MSGIVLSASVRQNLLSLQSTARSARHHSERLATGNKVNTALDNPTNFFTAQGLNNRASDINNLLDGIGNGVQVLQAANTGITSLQKLVDTAKSIANQVLQTTVGYSPKSTVSSAAARWRHRGQPGRRRYHQKRRRSGDRRDRRWNGDQHHLRRQRVAGPVKHGIGGQQPDAPASITPTSSSSPRPTTQPRRPSAPFTYTNTGGGTVDFRRRGARRLLMRPRRPFAPTWSASTTTSSRRSPPPHRTHRSTASTC